MKVSPYDKTGVCYASLEDVPEKAGGGNKPSNEESTDIDSHVELQVEAVNLIISPKIGVDVLNAMKKKGIRSVFAEMSSFCSFFVFLFF